MERIATINRDTKETKINMNLNIDGSGETILILALVSLTICLLTFQSMGLWI